MGTFSPFVRRPLLAFLLIIACCLGARGADVIFDVFVGYGMGVSDGVVGEASYFPVTVEVQNNGAGFNGVVEIVGGQFGSGMRRVVPLELPSGTKKRFTVPVWCAGKFKTVVDARLRNEKNKVVAEHTGLEPRQPGGHADTLSPIIASLSRTHQGAANLPDIQSKKSQLAPQATHLNIDFFPENPIALDGISTLYLHSARALELKAPQVTALMAWLHNGGRLVVGVEQPGDVKAAGWLQSLLPCELGDVTSLSDHRALQDWLTQDSRSDERIVRTGGFTNAYTLLQPDGKFESAPLQVTAAKLRDGKITLGTSAEPLMISAKRGRGELVVLLFSPELEPFKSWSNRHWFWAKLAEVPVSWLSGVALQSYPNTSLDGVFGAMVDSRQIRKLPIGWLLLLLIVYLVVIGPFDQFFLKKINKQMLTWITFPAYVAIFSGLIYFIGYALRSGESEWNELQIVDVIPHVRGNGADLRGRTYAAAYSPINATYQVASDQPFATLRGEVGRSGGEQSQREDAVEMRANSFAGRLAVPVWTSQLYVNDWWRQDNAPLNFTVQQTSSQLNIQVNNPSGKRFNDVRVIIGDRIYNLGAVTQSRTFTFSPNSGQYLSSFVQNMQGQFNNVLAQRNNQFGTQYGGHLENVFDSVIATSFLSSVVPDQNQNPWQFAGRFVEPRGYDLMRDVRQGSAVLMADLANEPFVAPLNKFSAKLSRKHSIVRVIAPVQKSF